MVLGDQRAVGARKSSSGSLCPGPGMAVTGRESGVVSVGVTYQGLSPPYRHTLRRGQKAREHQTHGTGPGPRCYLSDVFKGKLSSSQAGRANGGLAHWQPGRPGHLLSGPGQLGRLAGLNVDPVDTRLGGSGPHPLPQPSPPRSGSHCGCHVPRGQAPLSEPLLPALAL